MKKKLLALLLSMTMILSLVACGNSATDSTSSSGATESTKSSESTADESTESEDEIQGDATEEESIESGNTSSVEIADFQTSATIEEAILYDDNDIVITVTGIEYSNYDVTVQLLLENNSDKDLSFKCGTAGYSYSAVNGYMCSTAYLNEAVSAGMKANTEIDISIAELRIFGINEVADICLSIELEDDEYESFYTGPMQIYTTAADAYDYETDTFLNTVNDGMFEVLYDCTVDYIATDVSIDSEETQILSEGIFTNADGETVLWLEVENETDELLRVVAASVYINGLCVYDGTWSADSLAPSARNVLTMPLEYVIDSNFQKALGMEEIGSIAFTFSVRDEDLNLLGDEEEVSIAFSDVELDTSGAEIYSDSYVTLISKGLVEEASDYSDDIHLLILAVNNTDGNVYLDDEYDSLSVNDYMTDYYFYGVIIPAGDCFLLDVELDSDSLAENGVTSIEDIVKVSFTTEIYDNDYAEIGTPALTIEF